MRELFIMIWLGFTAGLSGYGQGTARPLELSTTGPIVVRNQGTDTDSTGYNLVTRCRMRPKKIRLKIGGSVLQAESFYPRKLNLDIYQGDSIVPVISVNVRKYRSKGKHSGRYKIGKGTYAKFNYSTGRMTLWLRKRCRSRFAYGDYCYALAPGNYSIVLEYDRHGDESATSNRLLFEVVP